MKKIPFYENHEDGNHCAVACYRMLFDHFMHRKMEWQEAEQLAGYKNGRAAWTVTIWERMVRMGFDIHMIEAFDYRRYEREGDAYLHTYFTPEKYTWQLQHTNIKDILPYIPPFLKGVRLESRSPTLTDIDMLLNDKRLVFVTLNAHILNGKEGFASHAMLILSKEGDTYIAHDPGDFQSGEPYRHIPATLLWHAMGGEHNTSEVTGIKLADRPTRADVLLARMHPQYSRAALAKLFDKGLATKDGKPLKPGEKLMPGTPFAADVSSLQQTAADIDLPVVYEDDDCIVINKPAGVLTHVQGEFNPEPTVASFLRQKSKELDGERAGVVHRLDRATSGIIIGAKNKRAMAWLQNQFAKRLVKKTYVAAVEGHLKQGEAIIDMPIERNPKAPATFRVGSNGKPATTHYRVIGTNNAYSLVELKPETGRTHQLRVHLAKLGHPIVGDPLYGHGTYGDRLFLHARSLEITLPDGEHRTFDAPLPAEFTELAA